ncbi:unnamed protein product [Porites evermanni]|uniref:Uncharacterized protein n=1 Tax=Porites evermanni TaxID=104178 RepID=A0ABN8QTQ6_9CNID|nr:unnamed protein product [Porites evermanni]
MEEHLKLVVDQEVVNSWETGGKSANMQAVASRLLQRLKDVLKVDHLVTDASPSTVSRHCKFPWHTGVIIYANLEHFLKPDMWQNVLHHVVGEHEWSDGQYSNSPLVSSDTDKPLLGKGSIGIRSPNKGHIGQEMARKFGLLCLVQAYQFA